MRAHSSANEATVRAIRIPPLPPPLLDVAQAAAWLNVSRATVYRLVDRGELHAVRVGHRWRLRREELEAYLTRSRKTPR